MDVSEFLLDSEIDPNSRPDLTYEQGYDEGKADCLFITVNHIGENGYTFEAYCAIRDTLVTAVYNLEPTEWQRGYGDGFDAIAEPLLEQDEE
jgi:hypothetical protein